MNTEKLIIEWEKLPTYNTIMALIVGVGLISIAKTGKNLREKENVNPLGWALNFGIIGLILFITGTHMVLTWPLAKYFPFDNIIFGEPTMAFGVILIGVSVYFWKQYPSIINHENPLKLVVSHIAPFSTLFYGLGLMLISIFFAGVDFQFFVAPTEEPISGNFADYPWLESWGLSLIFLGVGISSLLTGYFVSRFSLENATLPGWSKLNYIILLITGYFFMIFGAMNYYSHIGLILNTIN